MCLCVYLSMYQCVYVCAVFVVYVHTNVNVVRMYVDGCACSAHAAPPVRLHWDLHQGSAHLTLHGPGGSYDVLVSTWQLLVLADLDAHGPAALATLQRRLGRVPAGDLHAALTALTAARHPIVALSPAPEQRYVSAIHSFIDSFSHQSIFPLTEPFHQTFHQLTTHRVIQPTTCSTHPSAVSSSISPFIHPPIDPSACCSVPPHCCRSRHRGGWAVVCVCVHVSVCVCVFVCV
jgi:hypothetical protein